MILISIHGSPSLLAAVLQNDHKRLCNDLEAAILAVHEAARRSAKPRTDVPHATQPAPAGPSLAEATAGRPAVPPLPDADSGAQAAGLGHAEPSPSERATGGAPMETEEAASCQGIA